LAIHGSQLYFYEAGTSDSIYSMSTAGSTPNLIGLTAEDVFYLVADGSYIYGAYNYGQDFGRMPTIGNYWESITGGDPGSLYISSLRLNSTHIFQSLTLSSNYFYRIPKGGGTRELVTNSLSVNLGDFEVDDAFLYVRSNTQVTRFDLNGFSGSQVTSAEGTEEIADMALSGDGELIVLATDERIAGAAVAGATAATLVPMSGYLALADDSSVYFLHAVSEDANCASGTEIYGVPLTGGEPALLATDSGDCLSEAVLGDSALYYISGDGLSIKTVTK
jgi:hypothetical protein